MLQPQCHTQFVARVLSIILTTVFLTSCGGGGGGSEPAPVPAPPPSPTATISANPMTAYVDDQITLTWSSTNATSCEASDNWEGTKDLSGEETVTATTNGDLTYTITCSGNGSAVASVIVPTDFKTQFKEEPISIADPNLYPQVCNTSYAEAQPSIQFVIPVNINNDGWEDFIVHQWCDLYRDKFGEVIEDPTPDLLVVHLSNGDGTYRDGNEEVFGEAIPSLGGASRKYDRGDINGDGRDDFAFAMNWEDGRNGDPWEYSRASPAVIMSKGETEYEVQKIGTPDWGHAVTIVEHNNGDVDALFAGFTGIGLQALRYSNDGWINVIEEYPPESVWDENWTIIEQGTSQWSTEFKYYNDYIIATDSSAQNEDPAQGLALWKRADSKWQKIDQDLVPVEFYVDAISWQGSAAQYAVYLVDGEYVAGYTPETMCFMDGKFDNSENITFVALFGTRKHKEGETIIEGGSYNDDEFNARQISKVFQIQDDKIVEIEAPFDLYDEFLFTNFLDCRDINNDGYADFSRHVFSRTYGYEVPRDRGGTPVLSINNKDNKLIDYENNQSYEMPGHSLLLDAGHGQGYTRDINNDGLEDLVVFGETMRNEYNQYDGSIEIYLNYYEFELNEE